MKKFVVILFCLLSCNELVYAQDDMFANVGSIPGQAKDTAYINAIVAHAKSLRHKQTDSCILIYKQAFELSGRIGYLEGIAKSLTGLGLMLMDKGEYDKSMNTYRMAEPYARKATGSNGRHLAVLYNNIAALYGNRGVMDSAAMYYYKSLEEIELRKLQDTTLLILLYNNLGGQLTSLQQFDQAGFYLEKAEFLARETNNIPMLGRNYLSKAVIMGMHGRLDMVRIYARYALDIFETYPDATSQVLANCHIAQSYLEEGKPQRALWYYKAALDPVIHASETQRLPAYRGVGACYLELKEYKLAETYYLQALNISREAKIYKGVASGYKALVTINTKTGNYKQALMYRNAYGDLMDSVINTDKIEAFSKLEVKYRISEKDKELAKKELQLNLQQSQIQHKNILITTISAGVLLTLGLLVSMYRTRKHRQQLVNMELQKEQEVAQLKAMMKGEENERIRIARELHDGILIRFSTVQMNINALMEKSSEAQAKEFETILVQLEEATRELRKSTHNLMPDMLLREGLIEATHYFCNSLRSSSGLHISFQHYGTMPETIVPEYRLMLYRIIQELLHNIIKHAKSSSVLVQINCFPEMLSFVVEDNGVGFDSNQVFSKKGMGLTGITDRIRSLDGRIDINSRPGEGTSVYIEVDTAILQYHNTTPYAHKSSDY